MCYSVVSFAPVFKEKNKTKTQDEFNQFEGEKRKKP
jgi:hypothetical protein